MILARLIARSWRLAFIGVCVAAPNAAARPQVARQSVVVARPADMPRRAADLAADALARKALIESIINERMSPTLLEWRGAEIRNALEPLDALISHFSVVTRESLDGERERLLVDADVDLGAVLLRLVTAKVLTILPEAPRILLVPGPGTSLEMVKAIRSRLRTTLAAAGLELPAVEEVATRFVAPPATSALGVAAVVRQLAETRADLIAIITVNTQQAPSTVGGVVLDATVHFSVVRPNDNAIVGEQAFSTRGAGATRLLAEQAMLDDVSPAVARALGGQICSAVFAGANLIEPSAVLHRAFTVNVFYRPSGAATTALVGYLVGRNLRVHLGSSALADGTGEFHNRVGDARFGATRPAPADRLVVEGDATVEDLYNLLSNARFGSGNAFSVSVIEYADNYVGVEILDERTPPRVPKVVSPPPAAAVRAALLASTDGPRPPLQLHKKIQ